MTRVKAGELKCGDRFTWKTGRFEVTSRIESGRWADCLKVTCLRAATDVERARRLSERQCLYCFYLPDSQLAGQAFTQWQCRYCDHVGSHPNTAVPRCCNDCSDELGMCVDCGGSLDMRRVDKLRRRPPSWDQTRCERCNKTVAPGARVQVRFGIAAPWLVCVDCFAAVKTVLEDRKGEP